MSLEQPSSPYDGIVCCLEQELASAKPRFELLKEQPPLLIMEAKSDVVGFAIMNGSPRQSYESAYAQFKELYARQHQIWAGRYLSFILCRADNSRTYDGFYCEVENDVYFCRKYVIRLFAERDRLQQEIQQLPFVPLKPDSMPGLRRPLSALSLLHKCGVVSELARHIVKAGEKAGALVAKDYLAGAYGRRPFVIPKDAYQTGTDTAPSRSVTRLRSLSIRDFRAYRRQDFDLDADLVVFYGPNGLGKTSFFDALDFACTGRIARLSGHMAKVAPHLDSTSALSRVTLAVTSADGIHTITRDVDDRNHASFDQERLDRKELLFRLTGLTWTDTAARVENLERLFRATHLFGQDYQELLTDYRKESELPEDIVARMLAFEDYVAAMRKTKGVIDSLEDSGRRCSDYRTELSRRLKDHCGLRQTLAETAQKAATPAAAEAIAQSIAARVKRALHLDLPALSRVDQGELQNWRAIIIGEIGLTDDRLRRIASLESRYGQVISAKDKLAREQQRLGQCTLDAETAIRTLREKQVDYDTTSKSILDLVAEKDTLAEKHALNAWHVQMVKKSTHLAGKKTAIKNKLATLSLSIHTDPEELAQAEADLLWLQQNLSQHGEHLSHAEKTRHELARLQEERRSKEDQLNRHRAHLTDLVKRLSESELRISAIRDGESRLLAALNAVESLIDSSVCPACGTDHGTQVALLQNLAAQKAKSHPDADAAIRDHQGLNLEMSDLKRNVAALSKAIDPIQKDEESVRRSLSQLEQNIAAFRHRLERLGLTTTVGLSESIGRRLKGIQLLKEHAGIERELNDVTSELTARSLPTMIDVPQCESMLTNTAQRLSQLQVSVEERESHKKVVAQHLHVVRAHLNSLSEQQAAANSEITRLSSVISEYDSDLVGSELSASADLGAIQSKKAALQMQAREATEVRDEIVRLEMAIDACQYSARLTELDSEIARTKGEIKTREAELERITAAKRYFSQINDVLADHENTSVAEYTASFGPLASVIQGRLRHVYGFGPVKLASKSGKIYVQVSRKSDTLRPIDYFSDSQNQILMLSLFLATGMTQTWSSFAPIFLDDPITHFDDLNTYAFVEFIRGIISHMDSQRQFIISTCDENLWELFRQRCSTSGGKVTMYRFTAIGEEGPIVKQIA